jgi:hypothetical protein
MAFTSSTLVDIIFKKFITSQSTVDNSKQYFEEPYSSRNNVIPSDFWLQADQLPNTAVDTNGLLQQVTVTLTYSAGTKGGFYDSTGTLVDIVPFNYGDKTSYNYQIFRNNGSTSIALGECDWLFDNNAGVLTFYTGAVNGTVTNPQTSTVIATPSLPPVVKAWKYIGKKGVIPNLLGLTYSSGTMSINIGAGLTFSSGQLALVSGSLAAGTGLTLSGNTFSVVINTNGLTFSSGQLGLNIGSGLTYSSGILQTVINVSSGNGLTNSGNTFSLLLQSNSGLTVSSSGISLASNINGIGLTFTNGQLSLTNPIYFTNGITNSGNTYSVNINSNGLTFSSGQVSLNIGTGLTFSSNTLQSINLTKSGSGLTNSGNTFSILLDSNPGLTVSSNGLKVIDLIMTTSSVTLDTNILGKYTTDPTTLSGWGSLSIPTKGYVDAFASGLNLKQSVRVAATGSINLSSPPSQIDGITLSVSDRVLIWQQGSLLTGTISNGIYDFNGTSSAMTRSTDLDGAPSTEVTTGVYTFVTEGSTYQGAGFVIVASGTWSGTLPIGTAPIKWTQFSGAGNYTWNNGLISTGASIDVDLYTNGGLTFSGGQLLVRVSSGLTLSNGSISINSGAGLTLSNGQLSLTNPSYFSSGITTSGFTSSVDIGTGLTFSGNKVIVNPNIASNGLTYSNNGSISVDISGGLTFSGGKLVPSLGTGLTISNNNIIFDSTIVGVGLSWSGTQLSFSMTGSQNQLAFWGTTSSLLSTSNLTWNKTSGVLSYSTGSASSIYPLILENTTTGGGVFNGSVGFRLLSGSGTVSFYYAKSSGGSKNDNALNISVPNSGMTINANGQNGDGHNFEVYSSGYGGGNGNFYYIVNQNVGNPKGQFVLADSNAGSGQSEFVVAQSGLLTKLKGYTTGGALSYGTASQTNNIVTFTNQNIYLGSYSSVPTYSVIVEIAPGSSNLIPLKLNSGSLASTTQNGGIEFDGTHSYITINSSRYQMDNYLIGTGLTVSGLTLSGIAYTSGNGIDITNNTVSTKVDTTSGLYNNTGTMSINWNQVVGSGLTWSGSQINTTAASLTKFTSAAVSFTASVTQTITHNLGTTAFIIQMYQDSTGDEIMAQYTSRTTNSIGVTVFEDTVATVVIIG